MRYLLINWLLPRTDKAELVRALASHYYWVDERVQEADYSHNQECTLLTAKVLNSYSKQREQVREILQNLDGELLREMDEVAKLYPSGR
jgi:hypothetical protein